MKKIKCTVILNAMFIQLALQGHNLYYPSPTPQQVDDNQCYEEDSLEYTNVDRFAEEQFQEVDWVGKRDDELSDQLGR